MPRTIRAVPKKVRGRWVGSPRRVPKRAVAAKVVALVTGTARERGASERMAKKVAEAERLMRKGMEYCQMERSFSQLRREKRIFWHRDEFDCGCGVFAEVLRASSQRSAPRRMIAFVAPHITPTAIIFSIDLCWLSLSCTLADRVPTYSNHIVVLFSGGLRRKNVAVPPAYGLHYLG